jgi:hypothetical protein
MQLEHTPGVQPVARRAIGLGAVPADATGGEILERGGRGETGDCYGQGESAGSGVLRQVRDAVGEVSTPGPRTK